MSQGQVTYQKFEPTDEHLQVQIGSLPQSDDIKIYQGSMNKSDMSLDQNELYSRRKQNQQKINKIQQTFKT